MQSECPTHNGGSALPSGLMRTAFAEAEKEVFQ
jgi:hypothetical protein